MISIMYLYYKLCSYKSGSYLIDNRMVSTYYSFIMVMIFWFANNASTSHNMHSYVSFTRLTFKWLQWIVAIILMFVFNRLARNQCVFWVTTNLPRLVVQHKVLTMGKCHLLPYAWMSPMVRTLQTFIWLGVWTRLFGWKCGYESLIASLESDSWLNDSKPQHFNSLVINLDIVFYCKLWQYDFLTFKTWFFFNSKPQCESFNVHPN